MQETAFAKINLALHVRGREPDGYHRLETIFAFAEDGDRLSISPSHDLHLEVTGPFAAGLSGGSDNLVLRAAEALRTACRVEAGAALLLEKKLPVASGIGGGSADAAAALRLLDRFWGLGARETLLIKLAADLGADVPACIASRTARGEGRGDQLALVDGSSLAGLPLLLVNPGVPVATGAVFRAWDGVDRGALAQRPVLEAAAAGRNDLEAAARQVAPEIGDVLAMLSQADGAILARMSGSGATCFALFEREGARDQALGRIKRNRPDWWQLASRVR